MLKEPMEIIKMTFEQNEKIHKETEIIKANHILELQNTVTDLKNSFEGFHSRLEQIEKRICELKDRSFEIIKSEEQKVKGMKKSEQNLRNLWINICTIGITQKKRERKRQRTYLKK